MQELELKLQGGLMHEGGGVFEGFYGIYISGPYIISCPTFSLPRPLYPLPSHYILPLFSPFCSLALIDDNTLLIGSVDQIQMLHIQTIPLGETPKYTVTHTYYTLCVALIVIDFFYYYACVYAIAIVS